MTPKRLARHLKQKIKSKPYDSYICIDKKILEKIVEILENL